MKKLLTLFAVSVLGILPASHAVQVISVAGKAEQVTTTSAKPLEHRETLPSGIIFQTGKIGSAQLLLNKGEIVTLHSESTARIDDKARVNIKLTQGGLNVLSDSGSLQIEVDNYLINVGGYFVIKLCDETCPDKQGIYGKVIGGEAVIEYPGGRVVMQDKPFWMPFNNSGQRPTMLAKQPDSLTETAQLAAAEKAKVQLADKIRKGMAAFKAGDNRTALNLLQEAKKQAPSESLTSYYLGLVYLEIEQNDLALKHLQDFQKDAPQQAKDRGVNQIVTLLLTNQLQDEVSRALALENQLSQQPVEPGSVAVQPFANNSDPRHNVLAKGIAAMIIADLSHVPGLKVLERQKVQQLTNEIKLSDSGLVAQDAAVKAGRIIRAENIVIGNFGVDNE
ncbi:hypothetical protein C2869_09315 [Saccharobesus litoralis]|uniref:Uncharacterized protein n=1 Tax=Saccharobesus litoralis TaxID=2172099 RepID=A0A2S0VQX2_9ALTE|nr:CsgG/HfaB family protein [Saccharobesus litoralis]AWB66616.1 hypothetical protein C2869_09315 [Saccharobesus litoralis]